jgi:hypothetical protein
MYLKHFWLLVQEPNETTATKIRLLSRKDNTVPSMGKGKERMEEEEKG